MKKDLARHQLSLTKKIPFPNPYIDLMLGDFSRWTVTEEEAPAHRGQWRSSVFERPLGDEPMDLEIGTGNGTHFAHQCLAHPERLLVGLEIKYKPLIQSIRRVVRAGGKNGRMVRYHAGALNSLFGEGELDNIYIHFPDPWPKKRHAKNRLIQIEFLDLTHRLQRSGSFLEFKTDSRPYFDWAIEIMKNSSYTVEFSTWDLHRSAHRDLNFVTQFESLFLSKALPIHYARLRKK